MIKRILLYSIVFGLSVMGGSLMGWAQPTPSPLDLTKPNHFQVTGDLSNVDQIVLHWAEADGGPYTEIEIPKATKVLSESSHGITTKGNEIVIEWPGLLINGQPSTVTTTLTQGRIDFQVFWFVRAHLPDGTHIDTPQQVRDVR